MARNLLLLLSMAKIEMGKSLLKQFRSLSSPIMNFSRFMVEAVEARELPLVQILKEKYAPSLQRDIGLNSYIELIEKQLNSNT